MSFAKLFPPWKCLGLTVTLKHKMYHRNTLISLSVYNTKAKPEQGDKIPVGSSLTLLVGDGIPEEYPDSTIDEIPQNAEEAPLTDESWFN